MIITVFSYFLILSNIVENCSWIQYVHLQPVCLCFNCRKYRWTTINFLYIMAVYYKMLVVEKKLCNLYRYFNPSHGLTPLHYVHWGRSTMFFASRYFKQNEINTHHIHTTSTLFFGRTRILAFIVRLHGYTILQIYDTWKIVWGAFLTMI